MSSTPLICLNAGVCMCLLRCVHCLYLFICVCLFMGKINGVCWRIWNVNQLSFHTMSASAVMTKYVDHYFVLIKGSTQEVVVLDMLWIISEIHCNQMITIRKIQFILWQYSSDDTPLATTRQMNITLDDYTCKRYEKAKQQWMSLRCFLSIHYWPIVSNND